MNLRTNYMGFELRNPIIASASPLSDRIESIKRMEDHDIGAVVLFSIFEEQIKQEIKAKEYFPDNDSYKVSLDKYIELIYQTRFAVDIPIIASINGISETGWAEYAKMAEEAGANGIELNIYFIPSDLTLNGREVEQRYFEILNLVKSNVSIPVSIKLNPYFSSIGHMAKSLSEAGVDGLVLFNRFYQPDFDIEQMSIVNSLELSQNNEIRLPLLWIGILSGQLKTSLAASTGVASSTEIIKYLLAGADAVMTTSYLLRHGVESIGNLLEGIKRWMHSKNFESIDQVKGLLNHQNIQNPELYERANYIKVIETNK